MWIGDLGMITHSLIYQSNETNSVLLSNHDDGWCWGIRELGKADVKNTTITIGGLGIINMIRLQNVGTGGQWCFSQSLYENRPGNDTHHDTYRHLLRSLLWRFSSRTWKSIHLWLSGVLGGLLVYREDNVHVCARAQNCLCNDRNAVTHHAQSHHSSQSTTQSGSVIC